MWSSLHQLAPQEVRKAAAIAARASRQHAASCAGEDDAAGNRDGDGAGGGADRYGGGVGVGGRFDYPTEDISVSSGATAYGFRNRGLVGGQAVMSEGAIGAMVASLYRTHKAMRAAADTSAAARRVLAGVENDCEMFEKQAQRRAQGTAPRVEAQHPLWPGSSFGPAGSVGEASLQGDEDRRRWYEATCEAAWTTGAESRGGAGGGTKAGTDVGAEAGAYVGVGVEAEEEAGAEAQRLRLEALERICYCCWACIEAAWDVTAWLIRDRWACSSWATYTTPPPQEGTEGGGATEGRGDGKDGKGTGGGAKNMNNSRGGGGGGGGGGQQPGEENRKWGAWSLYGLPLPIYGRKQRKAQSPGGGGGDTGLAAHGVGGGDSSVKHSELGDACVGAQEAFLDAARQLMQSATRLLSADGDDTEGDAAAWDGGGSPEGGGGGTNAASGRRRARRDPLFVLPEAMTMAASSLVSVDERDIKQELHRMERSICLLEEELRGGVP